MPTTQTPNHLEAALFSSDPLPMEARQLFVDGIWPDATNSSSMTGNIFDFETYFSYVNQECDPDESAIHAITTYGQVVSVVDIIKENPLSTLEDLTQMVRQMIQGRDPNLDPASTKVVNSIQLVLRLWLMFNIRNLMTNRQELRTVVPWLDNTTLPFTLNDYTQRHQSDVTGMFSEQMNLYDMRKIAGFRVEWTNNLAQHLSMKGSVIFIFHNVSVLERMQKSFANSQSPLIPSEFIEETLRTIGLLIPLANKRCNRWLRDERNKGFIDGNILYRNTADRKKSRYRYWHDQLLFIEEAFDKTKPHSFFQWWHDTRDLQQWWGFWLVVIGIFLTILFGLIQSITGILQVAKPG